MEEKNEKKVEFEKQQCVVISIVKTVILSFEITDFLKKTMTETLIDMDFQKSAFIFQEWDDFSKMSAPSHRFFFVSPNNMDFFSTKDQTHCIHCLNDEKQFFCCISYESLTINSKLFDCFINIKHGINSFHCHSTSLINCLH